MSLTRTLSFVGALCVLAAAPASAQRAVGPVYDIVEPDMLKELQRKAKQYQATPEYRQKLRDSKKRSLERAATPTPVVGITPAFRKRSYYFDPTIEVEEDIVTPEGHVIARKGQRVNPLEQVPWRHTWFFLDGRDPAQVQELRRLISSRTQLVKAVLVAGTPTDVMRTVDHRVFFDQQGLYTTQFGIRSVPATVRQEGLRLRIDEYPIEARR